MLNCLISFRKQPNYMRSKPHIQALREAVDDDGVPLYPEDYSPIGEKNRPKRRMLLYSLRRETKIHRCTPILLFLITSKLI